MRIGIDLGGTKIEGIVLDDDGREVARRRIVTPAGPYSAIPAAIRDLVLDLERTAGSHCSVGVGTPGAISPATGLIKNANSTRLIGQALDKDLEHLLQRPVRVANDANCFAVSEAVDGAAAGCRVVFGVILGTGVGGGLVIDGRPLTGAQAIAGEWGHNPLPQPDDDERPGPLCYCGRHGCIETWLSGPALSRQALVLTGRAMDAGAIAAAADSGEPTAAALLHRYAHRLARGLGTVINLFDPDAIVLGGGLSRIEALYRLMPQLWPAFVFSEPAHIRSRLLPPRHGDSSGVRGAAWLWPKV
ncbi:MAG TPA: ROK family protein [Vineibacter sp.]|nr:ROK family protein [Vineibacter sp.]